MAVSMKSANPPRQLIIGLDSMEWELVKTWAAMGKMPTLARLMREGTHAVLASATDRFPEPVWNYMCSGLNPAHFSRYFDVQHDPDTGSMRYMSGEWPGASYFWDHLSEAGRRVWVIDAPQVNASGQLNGFQLQWGIHATRTAPFSNPGTLLGDAERRFGHHPVGKCESMASGRARLELRRRLLDGIKAHGDMFRHYAAQREWDTLVAVFSEAHCAGHIYWHDMDPSHPRHDATKPHQISGAIEDVYRAIDREVGTIIEAAGPGIRAYVVSAQGMGPLYHASWNLPAMLEHWGYGAASNGKPRSIQIGNPLQILRMIVPRSLTAAIARTLPQRLQQELLFRFYRDDRSWDGCRAFAVPNSPTVGAIRINLKGRDRGGIVEPGAEYEQICDGICAALKELTDPDSGRPLIKSISRVQHELRGPYLDRLPDITAQWDASFPWTSVQSPRFRTMKLRGHDFRTGSHTTNGFVIATGAGIAMGAVISDASIYDFAPTIMHAAGIHPPSQCEGRPLFRGGL
jgi:predicted AlkP superfamily phosphohydrolase/phosphomutase